MWGMSQAAGWECDQRLSRVSTLTHCLSISLSVSCPHLFVIYFAGPVSLVRFDPLALFFKFRLTFEKCSNTVVHLGCANRRSTAL